jgi:hypothetical protein
LRGRSGGERTVNAFLASLAPHFHKFGRVEEVQAFESVEAELGAAPPADYKAFLMWADGGETLPPLPRYAFYPLEELLPRRADGQPPDALEIATDDSAGFAFDLRVNRNSASYPVITYPLGDNTRDDVELAAEEFRKFFAIIQDARSRYE